MNIPLNDGYRLSADRYQWIVQKKFKRERHGEVGEVMGGEGQVVLGLTTTMPEIVDEQDVGLGDATASVVDGAW